MVEVCDGCASEFMVGSLFCHVCGASREARPSTPSHWTLYLEFHNIKRALGLSTASLVAFLIGMACLIMAGIAVGMIYSVQTFNDFQAVQLYRMQWLWERSQPSPPACCSKNPPIRSAKNNTTHAGPDALVRRASKARRGFLAVRTKTSRASACRAGEGTRP